MVQRHHRSRLPAGRDQILDATLDDIHALADLVDAALKQNNICVVGSEAAIQKEKELFKNVENL